MYHELNFGEECIHCRLNCLFCYFRFEGGGCEECSLLAEALSIALQVCNCYQHLKWWNFSISSIKLGNRNWHTLHCTSCLTK